MTILYDIEDNKLYFSSSIRMGEVRSWLKKFGRIPERLDQLVSRALQKAALEDGMNTGHRHSGNCAELLAIHQWAVSNPGKGLIGLKDF